MSKVVWSGLFFLLFASPAWSLDRSFQTLLHYQQQGTAFQSSVDDPAFFMDARGRDDPAREYRALLDGFRAEREHGDQSLSCRFPARRLYFEQRGLLPARSCPAFETWARLFPLRSLSLVFSTAYAGNSASMFGHTLLKMSLDRVVHHDLLDYGVGFLAQSNPEDGALSYTMKGLFGGYPGYFTVQPYYELVNQYAFAENRDLWELDIPLTDFEKRLFLAHLWELTHRGTTSYYFATVNCSTMLAELLDAVKTDWHVRDQLHGFILPMELTRIVGKEGGADASFRPSQRRLWERRMQGLSVTQRDLFRQAWAERSLRVASADAAVLDAILDRITIEKGRLNLQQQGDLRQFEEHVLLARSGLPTGQTFALRKADNNPLLGHAPGHLSLWAGRDDGRAALGLRLRWGWHDLLDPAAGFAAHYHLNVLDLRYQRTDATQKAQLKIAEVWSLSPWTVEDPLWSWTLAGSWSGDEQGGRVRQGGRFEAGAGISFAWNKALFSVLPGLLLEAGDQTHGTLRLTMLYLQNFGTSLRTLLRFMPGTFVGEADELHTDATAELRWDMTARYQLELRASRETTLRYEAGLGTKF